MLTHSVLHPQKRDHSAPWRAPASTIWSSQCFNVELRSLAPGVGCLEVIGGGRAVHQ